MFQFRVCALTGLLLTGFLIVTARLGQLQIVRHESYVGARASRNRPPEEQLAAPRGSILDRDGKVLAEDRPSFDLSVRANLVPLQRVTLEEVGRARRESGDAARQRAAFDVLRGELRREPWVHRLAQRVERGEDEIADGVLNALDQVARRWVRPATPISILRGLDEKVWTAIRIAQEDVFRNPGPPPRRGSVAALPATGPGPFPGLLCTLSIRRVYPNGTFLAHVLGTLGELSPDQTKTLRHEGLLIDRLDERTRIWAGRSARLEGERLAALRAALGGDPRALDVPELLARLRAIGADGRRRAARLGLVDEVRWSEQPVRVTLCDSERLWVGHGYPSRLRRSSRPWLLDPRIGETGVEYWHNEYLRGKHGLKIASGLAEDETGGLNHLRKRTRPREGGTLKVTISSAWQRACEAALVSQPRPAAMVVLDCDNGEVLALASYPAFDPNLFSPPREGGETRVRLRALLKDPAKPLLNRCISDHYPLGSVMKVFVAAVALEKGIISAGDAYPCSGTIRAGHHTFACDGRRAHGMPDVVEALRRSCNIFFFQVGAKVGVEGLAPWAHAIGFGRRTGIDLAGERPGVFPNAAWRARAHGAESPERAWTRGQDFLLAIGQGQMAVTPLQTACLMAVIANGGRAVTPRLKRGEPAPAPRAVGFSPQSLALVRQGMDEAVNVGVPGRMGTAYRAFHCGVPELAVRVAGKTGTAEVGGESNPHAWFAGYAPARRPQVAFCVFVQNGGHGGEVAAPLAHRVLRDLYGVRDASAADAAGPPVELADR